MPNATVPLRFPTRLTAPDLEESVKLTQGWSYRPRRILVEKYGYTSLGFALCGLCVMIFRSKEYATAALALGTMASAVVGFGFLTLVAARRRAALRRKLRKLNEESGTVQIDDEGVLFDFGDGKTLRLLWQSYQRALVGQFCLILFEAKKKFRILPISSLTVDQRAELVSLLRVNLGPDKTREC